MAKIKFTDSAVAKLPAPATGLKVYRDTALRGFGVRVLPSGTRSFILDYTAQDGQRHMLTLGPFTGYGNETVEARRKALLLQARIKGEEALNPAAAKRVRRAALQAEWTVAKACDDFRLKAAAKMKRGKLRESSLRIYEPKIEMLKARFGTRKLNAISKDDLQNWHAELTDQLGPVGANSTMDIVRAIFAAAVESGKLNRNPAKGVQRNEQQSRSRVLDSQERKAIWDGAGSLGAPFKQITRLLLLLGQRRSEVADMRWDELDLTKGVWTLPPDRCKNGEQHTVPLTPKVIEIISTMPCRSDLVFSQNGNPISGGLSQAKTKLDELAKVAAWTFHDLRRTVATGMAELGGSVEVTEKLLNHVGESRAGIARVYNRHNYMNQMKAALERWENHLLNTDQPNVVDLNARRGK